MTKILTIGTATRDIIANLDRKTLERVVMRNSNLSFMLLELGSKVEAKSISLDVGGGAINTAVSFSKLGLSVSTIVKIGKDDNAKRIIERLDAHNIDHSRVIISKTKPSAISLIISTYEKNPGIIIDRGANSYMLVSELSSLIDENDINDIDVAYIGNLSNKSVKCGIWMANFAKKKGLQTFLNPGIRQISAATSELIKLTKDIDYISLNSKEASLLFENLLTGRDGDILKAQSINRSNGKTLDKASLSFITKLDPIAKNFTSKQNLSLNNLDLINFVKLLIKKGIKIVIVTDSINGSFVGDKDYLYYCSCKKVTKMEGSAGAGDAYNSTFLASHLETKDVISSMIKASINAASVIMKPDTQSNLLTKSALETSYAKQKNDFIVERIKI